MKLDKSTARKIYREKRKHLNKQEVEINSQKICKNFIQNLLPKIYQKNSKAVFGIYLASGNEVATQALIEHFQKNNISFSYPKIVAPNQPLKFILANHNQAFSHNNIYANILEPVGSEEVLPDFLVIPLIAFDPHRLNRIGTGGGFFDRTIEDLNLKKGKIITIALAYDFQGLKEDVVFDEWDQSLDFVVSDNNIFSIESIDS